jgi:hypothetical protein
MKTLKLLLALAALFTAQVINAGDVPTPVGYAQQYNGGVLCWVDPVLDENGEPPELYYFWRDGVMIGWGTEPSFIDYPDRSYHVYQVQVSVDWVAGLLSEPVIVDLTEPVIEPVIDEWYY